ncbi:MAG: 16S rRNA processing protein RimM [Gammaproteobacteria bacterium RIFCSPHIGHO2_12_FULL_42_13]|nr:MAG: 16S rRNA processing protein RimM [Gammaproteobacteria bacterium RIFCSPHIGHO2_12_FULL_42_13]
MIVIGRLGDAFGVRGWLHLYSYAHPPENIFHYANWQVNHRPTMIEAHRPHGNHFVVKLRNCDDRDQALLLKHQDIQIDRTELPALSEGEYYWSDLIGLRVIDTNGKLLGVVDHLFSTGSNDVIAVHQTESSKPLYLPYLKQVIQKIDLREQIILVDAEAVV